MRADDKAVKAIFGKWMGEKRLAHSPFVVAVSQPPGPTAGEGKEGSTSDGEVGLEARGEGGAKEENSRCNFKPPLLPPFREAFPRREDDGPRRPISRISSRLLRRCRCSVI